MLSLPNVTVLYILPLVKPCEGKMSTLEGGRKTQERKWGITLYTTSNTDPARAGAEGRRAVKQGELAEAAPVKAATGHPETRRRQ